MSPIESHSAKTADVPRQVRIVEVGPRDGLQNERAIIATDDKVQFIQMLAASGLTDVEVSSFVSAERVPQLADADIVFQRLSRRSGVRYTALVANERGLDRAIAANVDGIALFTAASEAFAERNIGKSIEASLTLFQSLSARARDGGLWVRAYVSTAFDCPFAGPISPDLVAPIVARLLAMEVDEISIADTIGSATPEDVADLTKVLLSVLPTSKFAFHFHDTRGAAVRNVEAALDFGISNFDSSAGGLGGCPFAPGAPGNQSTEGLVDFLTSKNITTGVDVSQVRSATEMLRTRRHSVDNS